MARQPFYDTQYFPKTLIIGVHTPYNRTEYIDSYFDEFCNLVKTDGIPYETAHFVKVRAIDSAYFFTKGKLHDILELCKKHAIEHIIISESLTPQQERNLSNFLECTISDRTKLILGIFKKAAHSAEGKAQVAIAMLNYRKSRLAGKGIHLSQQTAAIGMRGGPGETAKEIERRHIEQEIKKLRKQIATIDRSRSVQRKRRLDSNVPHICLIGYTNAGKSTILNMLTKSDVLAEDKLFATLDTTTRELYIEKKKIGIISDTVGFIQQLPHHLIDAFKSTLSELHYAHLLLHVIDVSDPNWQLHSRVVQTILEELNIDKKMIYVFNKADKIDNKEQLADTLASYQPHVLISAQSKESLQPLIHILKSKNVLS